MRPFRVSNLVQINTYLSKCIQHKNSFLWFLTVMCIQLFQLTLLVQSIKLKDKTESLRGIFMNKLIKISHAWRKQ